MGSSAREVYKNVCTSLNESTTPRGLFAPGRLAYFHEVPSSTSEKAPRRLFLQ